MIFHVINRGNDRGGIFDDDADYAAFMRVLAETLELVPGMRLLSYCLMPNHWHLVLWPRGGGELGRFVQRLTVTHVRRWHEHRRSTGRGHLYQGTYKSFPVQSDRHLVLLCRYVERNALRAGKVERAEQWLWSSLWLGQHTGTAPAKEFAGLLTEWPLQRPGDWAAFVNRAETPAELAALRESVRRGRPWGEPAWQQRTAKRLNLQATFRRRGRPRKNSSPRE